MIKLDIGSGRAKFEDYMTVDNDPSVGADICCDVFNLSVVPQPVEEIRCHHFLEHLKSEDKVKIMAKLYDLLEVGGILNIEIPLFPSPASVQDPTHLSFWNKESFKYFTKGDPFGEAFAKRYSQYKVPLFEFVEEWYRGEKPNRWAYGTKLKKVK